MVRALLFDLDGTLVHTNPVHLRAWQQILAPRGVMLDEAQYVSRISGRRNHEIVRELFPGISDQDNRAIRAAKEARFRELAVELEPLAGVRELLAWAGGHGVATTVVSNAPRENATLVLERAGLHDRIDDVVLAEDAGAGKPDPAPYLLALRRLRIPPTVALAFEDSPTGIESCRAAGLRVVGIASSHPVEELLGCGADPVVGDFLAPALWRVLDARPSL